MMVNDWSSKKVVIVGAARQGLALARYLLSHGARVLVNDQRPLERLESERQALSGVESQDRLEWVAGGHPFDLLDGVDLLCPSGGVPLSLPLVQEAVRRGISLSNDSQIFLEIAPCWVIGITGSAGKTTTTTLVGRMAQAAVEMSSLEKPARVWVGGNIGSPLITDVDAMGVDDLAVMELSSFQLEIMDRSPQVGAILNVTPNHLDRHKTMHAYTRAKARLLQFQQPHDAAILGRDDAGAWALADEVQGKLLSFGFSELETSSAGTYLKGDRIFLRSSPGLEAVPVLNVSEVALRGMHNLLNVMAACTIAAAAGLPAAAMQSGVHGFRGVAHRLEPVRRWGGADWVNDSIATAPERAMAAIRSFDEPLVMLAGGRDKDLPWDDFARLVLRRVDHLVLFGEAVGVILQALERVSGRSQAELASFSAASSAGGLTTISCCSTLQDAVKEAARLVQPGDIVLLSPGGTSFDEFNDFEERGKCFAQWVRELP